LTEEYEMYRKQTDNKISLMKLEYDNELQDLKSKMEEEMGSMAKQYSEDPRPLKAQINNLKADVKALNAELNQTKIKYTE